MEALPRHGELSDAGGAWAITTVRGDAGAFHGSDPVARRSATIVAVSEPTLVLGSAQSDAAVDGRVARCLGVDVVRRRSGGGAVLLVPGEFAWLDLVIPAGDPLWSDDVGAAMEWVGRAWHDGLAALGVAGAVHGGAMQHGRWSAEVCFAGRGTGEVFAADDMSAKLVGISQRRTRSWARFQTMCHVRWRPELVSALVAAPRPSPGDLAGLVRCVPCSVDDIVASVVAHLPS